MGGTSNNWRAIVPLLSAKCSVIAPGLLGRGQSANPRGDYSRGAFAKGLQAWYPASHGDRPTGRRLRDAACTPARRLLRVADLLSSGDPSYEANRTLRLVSLPGSEVVVQLVSSQRVIKARMVGSALTQPVGPQRSPTRTAALANRENRHAFSRTFHTVIARH